jgi:hypothetical protein
MRWFEVLQMIEIGSSQYEVRTKTLREEYLQYLPLEQGRKVRKSYVQTQQVTRLLPC